MRVLPAVVRLLLVAGVVSCRGGAPPAARTRPPPLVAVAKVEARDVQVAVRAPVDLRPLYSSEVGSKTVGYLDAVFVDRGDRVRRGQLVALVRPSDLPDQMAAERGSLEQIRASLALSRNNLERARRLAPDGIVSQQELQNATGAVASAEAAEVASQARIAALATRLGETRIFAPMDGYVALRRLDPGALVGPGAGTGSILSLVSISVLRVFIAVNERDSAGVRVGLESQVDLDAYPGRAFRGRVVRIAPAMDPTTRTFDAEVQLANPGDLRPGMYGRGRIVTETHRGAPVLPAGALVVNVRGAYTFVLEGDKVRRREVRTGFDEGDWLEILEGVKPGDEVVVAGADGLADGATVRVHRTPAPAPSVAPEPGPDAARREEAPRKARPARAN